MAAHRRHLDTEFTGEIGDADRTPGRDRFEDQAGNPIEGHAGPLGQDRVERAGPATQQGQGALETFDIDDGKIGHGPDILLDS